MSAEEIRRLAGQIMAEVGALVADLATINQERDEWIEYTKAHDGALVMCQEELRAATERAETAETEASSLRDEIDRLTRELDERKPHGYWYAACYRAHNGNIRPFSAPTAIREHAEAQVRTYNEHDSTGYFLGMRPAEAWVEA